MATSRRSRSPLTKSYLDSKNHTYTQIQHTPRPSYLQNYKKRVQTKPQLNYSELVHPKTLRIVYQNGIYQGSTVCKLTTMEIMRHGEGAAIYNDGTTVVSTWIHSKLDGLALVFPPKGGIIYCEFVNNMLNGWTIYKFQSKYIVCQLYHLDKLQDGKFTYESSNNLWFNTTKQYSKSEKCSYGRLPKMIKSEPLQKRLTNLFQQQYDLPLKEIHIVKSEQLQYFGFVNYSEKPEGLGIIHSSQEKYIGNFFDGELHLCGRILFGNGDIYSGGFKKGNIFGEGTYYNFERDVTIISSLRKTTGKLTAKQKRGVHINTLDFRNQVKVNSKYMNQYLPMSNSIKNIFKVIEIWYESRRQKVIEVKVTYSEDEVSRQLPKPEENITQFEKKQKLVLNDFTENLETTDKKRRKLSVYTPKIQTQENNFLIPPLIAQTEQPETIQQYQSLIIEGSKQNEGKRIPMSSQLNVNLKDKQEEGVIGSNLKFDSEKAELTFRKKMTEDIEKRLKDIPSTNNLSELGKKLQALVTNIPRKKRIFDKSVIEKIHFQ